VVSVQSGRCSRLWAASGRWAVSWVGCPVWVVGRQEARLGVLVSVSGARWGRASASCRLSVSVPGFWCCCGSSVSGAGVVASGVWSGVVCGVQGVSGGGVWGCHLR